LLVFSYTFLIRALNCLFVSPYMRMLRHYLILHTRSDQLLVATRILLASGRLSEHFYQIPSFNRMYPFFLTLDERQSIGQKTGRRAKQQQTGKPIVPQPERLNKMFPTQRRLGTAPPRRRGRRRSLGSRAKGTAYATVRSRSKAQPLLNPTLLELDASHRNARP